MGKSRRARQLMADKDAQLAALQARVGELSNTVATGNPTERRIFALAQAQVSREQEVRVCAAWLVGWFLVRAALTLNYAPLLQFAVKDGRIQELGDRVTSLQAQVNAERYD